MQCGAKCFVVQFNKEHTSHTKDVIARTPAAARKTIRKNYGESIEIKTVREKGSESI